MRIKKYLSLKPVIKHERTLKKSHSLVSLVIRTKNEERWISSCLDAVFKQSYKNFEVIIVDNGSTDKTIEIAKSFGQKVHLFNFTWVDDFSAARNESLKHATCDWILVLDADEIILEEDKQKIKSKT